MFGGRAVDRPRFPRAQAFAGACLLILPRLTSANEVGTSTPTITIERALESALARSSEIALAKDRIDQASVNIARALALVLPTWNASSSYTHREPKPPTITFPAFPNLGSDTVRQACADPNDPTQVAPTEACIIAVLEEFGRSINAPPTELDFARRDTVSFSSQVTWTVLNGRYFTASASADDAVRIERDRLDASRSTLIVAVSRAYYAALTTQRSLEVARRALSRAAQKTAVERTQSALGQAAPLRLRASEIHLREAELDVSRAEVAHQRSLQALALAAVLETPADVVTPKPQTVPDGDEDALTRRALETRPELLVARRSIDIAERELDAFWWSFAPTIALFGAFRASNVEGITGQKSEWTLGVNANLTLFDAGLRYAERDEAASKISSARHNADRLFRSITNEIRSARLSVKAAALSKARAQTAVDLAETTLDLARQQHQAGTIREIDLREAVDAVADAELAVVRADFERDLAVLELRAALGTLED